jgi:murein DD-endopeptidase MepM/ murein hydrolase activator NlpD
MVKKPFIVLILVASMILFGSYSFYSKTNKASSLEKPNVSSKNSQINISKIPNPMNEKLINEIKNRKKSKKWMEKESKVFNQKDKLTLFDKIQVHTVKFGENLSVIAKKYNIDIDTLLGANDISNMNNIKPGMELKILPVKGLLYKLGPGESLWQIAHKFDVKLNKVVEANNIQKPEQVKLDKLLILPGAVPEFGYKERLKKRFISPVIARISSPFGRRWGKMHEGIDYAVQHGTSIKAAREGRVVYSGWARGYGKVVILEHRKGLRTLYAHNSKLLVHSGERVYRGEIITKSGNTGRSTGPHLHFEIQINGRPVNPLNYFL